MAAAPPGQQGYMVNTHIQPGGPQHAVPQAPPFQQYATMYMPFMQMQPQHQQNSDQG